MPKISSLLLVLLALSFVVVSDMNIHSKIDLDGMNLVLYKDTICQLPLSKYNFIGSNPSVLANPGPPAVKVKYTHKTMSIFEQDETVGKIHALDHASFIGVVEATAEKAEQYRPFLLTMYDADLSNIIPSHPPIALETKEILVKAFRLNGGYCLITRLDSDSTSRVAITCHKSIASADTFDDFKGKIISNEYSSISEIQVVKSSDRVDLLFTGKKEDAFHLLHQVIQFEAEGPKERTLKPLDKLQEIDLKEFTQVADYVPSSVIPEYFGSLHNEISFNLKMDRKDESSTPIVVRFSLDKITGKIQYLLKTDVNKNAVFCRVGDDTVSAILNGKTIAFTKGEAPSTEFSVSEVNLDSVLELLCVPDRKAVQVLAAGQAKRQLLTFHVGELGSDERRLHSVVLLEENAKDLQAVAGESSIVTMHLSQTAKNKINLVTVLHDGPALIVNTAFKTALAGELKVALSMVAGKTNSQGKLSIALETPVFKPQVTITKRFDEMKEFYDTINVDDYIQVDGAVTSITMPEIKNAQLIPRLNLERKLDFGESGADKVIANSYFFAALWRGKKYKLYGDKGLPKWPAVEMSKDINQEEVLDVRDIHLADFGLLSKDAVFIIKHYHEGQYKYSLSHLSAGPDPEKDNMVHVPSSNIYETGVDYEELQVVAISTDEVVVSLHTADPSHAHYIHLVAFKRNNENKYEKSKETTVAIDPKNERELGSYSLVAGGNNNALVIFYHKHQPDLFYAAWYPTKDDKVTVQKSTSTEKFQFKKIEPAQDSITSLHMKWWPTDTKQKFDVLIHPANMPTKVLYFVVTLSDNVADGNLINKIEDNARVLQLPPGFDIYSMKKGKEFFGFWLRKLPLMSIHIEETDPAKGVMNCHNMIALYHREKNFKDVSASVHCRDLRKTDYSDFDILTNSGDYLFYVKAEGESSAVVSTVISPLRLFMTNLADLGSDKSVIYFTGLKGSSDESNLAAIALKDLTVGYHETPVMEHLKKHGIWWALFIILILASIIGGFVWWYTIKRKKLRESMRESLIKRIDRLEDSREDEDESKL